MVLTRMGSKKKEKADVHFIGDPPPPPPRSKFLGLFRRRNDKLYMEEGPTSLVVVQGKAGKRLPGKAAGRQRNDKYMPRGVPKKRLVHPGKAAAQMHEKVRQEHERIEAEQRRLMEEAEDKWRKRQTHEQHVRNALHHHIRDSVEQEHKASEERRGEYAKLHYHLTRRAFKEKIRRIKLRERQHRQQLADENELLKEQLSRDADHKEPADRILGEQSLEKELVLTIPSPPRPPDPNHMPGLEPEAEVPPAFDEASLLSSQGEINPPPKKPSFWARIFGKKQAQLELPAGLEEIDKELQEYKSEDAQLDEITPPASIAEDMPQPTEPIPQSNVPVEKNMDFIVSPGESRAHLKHLRSKEGKLKEKWSKKKMLYEQQPALHEIKVQPRAAPHLKTQHHHHRHVPAPVVEVPDIGDVPAVDWTTSSPKSEEEIRSALQSIATRPDTPAGKIERWIGQVQSALEMGNAQDARAAYVQAMKIYLALPGEEQQKVYGKLQAAYDMRQKIIA